MKAKKYSKGGKVDPPKKKMTKEERQKELTKMASMAKGRLEEMEGEKKYLKKRKEADRAYRQAIKEGASEDQANRIAEKYLSYKKGGILPKAIKKAGYKK
jgi:nucleosome binding factor SPN SPT16 subunit